MHQPYDGDLQMLLEQPKGINVAHLTFIRWLCEQGRLEHPVAGPSSGAFVPRPAADIAARYEGRWR